MSPSVTAPSAGKASLSDLGSQRGQAIRLWRANVIHDLQGASPKTAVRVLGGVFLGIYGGEPPKGLWSRLAQLANQFGAGRVAHALFISAAKDIDGDPLLYVFGVCKALARSADVASLVLPEPEPLEVQRARLRREAM